jgi:hypothetical protein
MSESKLQPFADLRVKTGTYQKDGQTKNRYITIGTLLSTPHHSNMVIRIDSLPTSKDWDGTVYVNQRDTWQPEDNQTGDLPEQSKVPF